MAIIGIGTDITSVARIAQAIARHPRWVSRVFTPAEVDSVGSGPQRIARLAGRFAVKEALVKAAGGLHGSGWHDLEVIRRPRAAAAIVLHGPLQEWAAESRLTIHVSLAHEKAYAVAVVVLEQGPETGTDKIDSRRFAARFGPSVRNFPG